MGAGFTVKPTHKAVKSYYAALATYAEQSVEHEGALRSAFLNLLADTGRKVGWTLIPELSLEANGQQIRPDGTFRDEFTIERGYWEAKDTDDDLEAEIKKIIKRGYRLTNTIFEDTREGRLYQDGKPEMIANLRDPQQLCDLLNAFFSHTEPAHEDFSKAVEEFKQRVPDLARGLVALIEQAHKGNRRFIEAFGNFHDLCKQSLNPNLSTGAVDEMLVQHLLTERLIRTVFDSQDFTRRNVIAAEIEKVIDALVSQSFNRHEYLKRLDRFYVAIEHAARTISGFAEKQHFLNVVYERFFQGYSVKVADTHGIIYTPQEIVDFMCASVGEVLEQEFGKKLGDPGVNILDPCTGTGNFIVNLMRRIPKRSLPRMYREQLFANEVMLLPYYIAALNIEHAYYERTGQYEAFEGLCFVDTLDLAEGPQQTFGFMAEENVQRVERQRKAPITVIIGNPPYNAKQLNENDNNKNRKYAVVDGRVRATYSKDSAATSRIALQDMYVKFFRWAIDRLGSRNGIVCLVSNNGFVDKLAFDGMRKHLSTDFTSVYHVDLHGDVRDNPRLSGTTHNVFGIQIGVGITVAARTARQGNTDLLYYRVPENWRREEKLAWLRSRESVGRVEWTAITPDSTHTWIVPKSTDAFSSFVSLGSKEGKASKNPAVEVVFKIYSRGVATCRDDVVYDFCARALKKRVRGAIQKYNAEVHRYRAEGLPDDVDSFVSYDALSWSMGLKNKLRHGTLAEFQPMKVRPVLYRPFCHRFLFLDRVMNEAIYQFAHIFPDEPSEANNRVIVVGVYGRKPFSVFASDRITDLNFYADPAQCFPFYVYDEDGTNRRENVTDWALKHFREHYGDAGIGKWDIFYYVYGVLHHPGYRAKFADNLKRELPRIPLAPGVGDEGGAGEGGVCRRRPLPHGRGSERDDAPLADERGSEGHDGPLPDGRGSEGHDGPLADPEHRDGSGRHDAPLPDGRGSERRGAAGGTDRSSGFWAFSEAGRRLAELHVGYESVRPWGLEWIETAGEPLSYRVEKMRLSKDKKSIEVNESLTLAGIPAEVFEYRLGNRSALEWVIDQYRVKEDKRSGIRSDPNNPEDPEYIVRLVGQVVRVSVETVKIVKGLPEGEGGES